MSQETKCCSEKEVKDPVLALYMCSKAPVVEKDQQDPQFPWFLTPVTYPLERQSIEEAKVDGSAASRTAVGGCSSTGLVRAPRLTYSSHSSLLMWENWLWAKV